MRCNFLWSCAIFRYLLKQEEIKNKKFLKEALVEDSAKIDDEVKCMDSKIQRSIEEGNKYKKEMEHIVSEMKINGENHKKNMKEYQDKITTYQNLGTQREESKHCLLEVKIIFTT